MRSRPVATRRLYRDLRQRYGRPQDQWALWCKRPKTVREQETVVLEAILTQRTSWRNVALAVASLRRAGVTSLAAVSRLGRRHPRRLAALIRPAGFFRTKARYLTAVAGFFEERGGPAALARQPLGTLRRSLLELPGVGPETADSILCYALGKPSFVVDEYTRRLATASQLAPPGASYETLQQLFSSAWPRDVRRYQDFHALIVVHGKQRALARPV